MKNIYVVGAGMTRFGPHPSGTIKALTKEAVALCLEDAGATRADVEAAFFANSGQAVFEGQISIPGQIAMKHAGVEGIPIVNVENACASGSTAFWLACRHLESGAADIVLAVGAEKMVFESEEQKEKVLRAFEGGMDISEADATLNMLLELGSGVEGPSGTGHRTRFMDIYAALCRAHMAQFGTTQQQLAIVASKNHDHAKHNEKCHFRAPISVEQVLQSRALGFPLTVAMCSPMSNGAAAVLLCTESGLKRLSRSAPPVAVRACELRSATSRKFSAFEEHVARRAARAAYERAGLGPDDIDVAEVHDATAFGEIFMSELLEFCSLGEGGKYAESGATRIGGALPINPSGGLASRGHPIAATGLAQIFELTLQLRGAAGQRQVHGARNALQENSGGLLGFEEGAAVVTILQRMQ